MVTRSAVIFATGNRGKLREAQEVARESGLNLCGPADLGGEQANEYGLASPLSSPLVLPEELHEQYEDNAREKAECAYRWCGIPSIGDDSGLEVDALGGAPGVHTARFAGPGASSEENIRKLLSEMTGAATRTARFRCVLAYYDGRGAVRVVSATLEGAIAHAPSGSGGFGYDPVFLVAGQERTLAELKAQGIAIATHRIKALRILFADLAGR